MQYALTPSLEADKHTSQRFGEMISVQTENPHIDAMPTKAFFVDMLVRDIAPERAVLDLIDNCIDGARRLHPGDDPDFNGLFVRLSMDEDHFEIIDNCGGFDIETAQSYAFRFGRPTGAETTDYSIGQFGVGMKRALFKFGRYFEVHSTTESQKWSMKVDVDRWEKEEAWIFDFDDIDYNYDLREETQGTRIIVKKLRPETASRFSEIYFRRRLSEIIRSHQRRFSLPGSFHRVQRQTPCRYQVIDPVRWEIQSCH